MKEWQYGPETVGEKCRVWEKKSESTFQPPADERLSTHRAPK